MRLFKRAPKAVTDNAAVSRAEAFAAASEAVRPPRVLTASILCREAIMILRNTRHIRETSAKMPANAEPLNPIDGLLGLNIFVEDDALGMTVDGFADKYLVPTIRAWAPSFYGAELGDEPLAIAQGVLDCRNERYDGVCMRCVIIENVPVGDRDVPSRVAKYYDINADEWKTEPCSMAVSLWVHTPDTAATMRGLVA